MKGDNVCIREQANPVQIRDCREKVAAGGRSFAKLSGILSLAGNEVRLKILYLLEEEKELCPCDLSDILGMSIPAISQHLRKLKDGSIVTSRKEGQTIYYRVTPAARKLLRPLLQLLNNKTILEVI